VAGSDLPRSTVPHVRVVAGGTFPNTPEIWTCTLKLASFATPASGDPFVQILDDINLAGEDVNSLLTGTNNITGLETLADTFAVPAWKALWGNAGRGDAELSYVKVNAFGTDDRQSNPVTVDRQFAPVSGGAGGGGPFTIGVNCEWRTSQKSRGYASHGRMTLPVVTTWANGEVQAYGQFASGQTHGLNVLQQQVGTFLSSLNAPAGNGRQFIPAIIYTQIVGAVYKSGGSARVAQANAIDKFFVSSLPAITRRRGNKLPQQATASAAAYGAPTGGS
jgi:hypothetical protein